MINKNIPKQNTESKNQQQSPKTILNATTTKQRNSTFRMQEQIEVEGAKSGIHRIEDGLVEDGEIEPEPEHHQSNSPGNVYVSSPRRSLIRQNQLWAEDNKVGLTTKQQLLFASDEYYNQNVPNQTLSFLEKIRALLFKEEQTLMNKRKAHMQTVLDSIRAEFASIRNELVAAVEEWCRRVEEEELSYFVKKGELAISGGIEELTARVTTRREEIEGKISELNLGLAQSHLVNKEEALKRNYLVKRVVKEVWSRDYQLQVSQLQEEGLNIRAYDSLYHYHPARGRHHEKDLNFIIHDILLRHGPFNFPPIEIPPSLPDTPKKIEQQSLSPPSSIMREQILQSLMEERMREINFESRKIMNQYYS